MAFFLLSRQISLQFGFDQLYARCLQELIHLEFQQLLIHKFDFLGCRKQTLQHVFTEYRVLCAEGLIEGLKSSILVQLTKECSQKFNITLNFDFGSSEQERDRRKEMAKTIGSGLKHSESVKQEEGGKRQQIGKSKSYPSEKTWSPEQIEVLKLQQINSNMVQENNIFKKELQELQFRMCSTSAHSSSLEDISELQQKCREFSQLSSNQNQRLQALQSQLKIWSGQLNRSQKLCDNFQSSMLKKPRTKSGCWPLSQHRS